MVTRRRLIGAVAGVPVAGELLWAVAQEGDILWPTRRWARAEPEEVGLDRALLLMADERAPVELPDLSALLVVRRGRLVLEREYGDYVRHTPINVRSVTKSVISALVGIALGDGILTGLDQPLGDLIPDRIPAYADPRTPSITLRHLLTMTSGWAWDIYSDYPTVIASDNWIELTLGLPVVYEPGTYYAYNTGGSHVLSVILQEVTGQKTADFAAERLFAPLGIESHEWVESPQGESSGGFGLFLTPREMAKIGFLFLNQGRWEDTQLVPADYAVAATMYQSAGDSTGLANYGFQWWVTSTYGLAAYFALGYGGQYIYVIPDLEMIVVTAVDRLPDVLRAPRPLIDNLIVAAAFEI